VLGRLSTHSTVVFTVTQATSAVDPPTRVRPATHPVRINRPRPPRAPAKRLGGRATSTLSSRACPGLERAWPSQRWTWIKFAGPNQTEPNPTQPIDGPNPCLSISGLSSQTASTYSGLEPVAGSSTDQYSPQTGGLIRLSAAADDIDLI